MASDRNDPTDIRKVVKLSRVPRPGPSSELVVLSIDYNVNKNASNHHTDRYIGIKDLIIRRGQEFDVAIGLNRKIDFDKEELKFIFTAGEDPYIENGTRVIIGLSGEGRPNSWAAGLVDIDDTKMVVRLNTPANCYVGIWRLAVEVNSRTAVVEYHDDVKIIYILFNPWCPEDQVFFPNEELLRKEYVMRDHGIIYAGTSFDIGEKPWHYGQFDKDVLPCAMYLLDIPDLKKHKLPWTDRGDSVKVARRLTALVNKSGWMDSGVLVGRWGDSYEDGTRPTSWNGSVAILKEYYNTKQPVKYGQCWVFAGVLTTICRTLGIPCRTVTNFNSAHDTHQNIIIEKGLDTSKDSVWNFHVWNGCWMTRPDLPPGYGGWQAIDATPQEMSGGTFQCGPASLRAIKHGEINLNYDGAFVTSEVNGDVHYFSDGKLNWIDKDYVGQNISTLTPGTTYQRDDITHLYKFEEGSKEERTSLLLAKYKSGKHDVQLDTRNWDVDFRLKERARHFIGKSFGIALVMENKSISNRTVVGSIFVNSMSYTGILMEKIKTRPVEIKVDGNSTKEVYLEVKYDEYMYKIQAPYHLKMRCVCKVKETKQTFAGDQSFRLRVPNLDIKVASRNGRVGKKMTAELSFTNPLSVKLTKCMIIAEGTGIEFKQRCRDVNVRETFKETVEFTPQIPEEDQGIEFEFISQELEDVNGELLLNIDA